jgi:hypothetical protein
MAIDHLPERPTEPIRIPWRAADDLTSGRVHNFFQAMDLTEQMCQQERDWLYQQMGLAPNSAAPGADEAVDMDQTQRLIAYQLSARHARRIYARFVATYNDGPEARRLATMEMRHVANRPHATHNAEMERIADALESGDYTTLAL